VLKQAKKMDDTLMKAIVNEEYGPLDVLQFKEVNKPTPKDDEVLVQIFAASNIRGVRQLW